MRKPSPINTWMVFRVALVRKYANLVTIIRKQGMNTCLSRFSSKACFQVYNNFEVSNIFIKQNEMNILSQSHPSSAESSLEYWKIGRTERMDKCLSQSSNKAGFQFNKSKGNNNSFKSTSQKCPL